MAKSIRSKRKRKLRAIKRVRYAEKELARLKQTLGIVDKTKEKKDGSENAMDVVEVPDVPKDANCTVEGNVIEFSLKKEKNKSDSKKENERIGVVFPSEAMKMDVVTLNDIKKLGGYPKWMNQRYIHKMSKIKRRNKNKIKRIQKSNKRR